jgi:hypothetical protein
MLFLFETVEAGSQSPAQYNTGLGGGEGGSFLGRMAAEFSRSFATKKKKVGAKTFHVLSHIQLALP